MPSPPVPKSFSAKQRVDQVSDASVSFHRVGPREKSDAVVTSICRTEAFACVSSELWSNIRITAKSHNEGTDGDVTLTFRKKHVHFARVQPITTYRNHVTLSSRQSSLLGIRLSVDSSLQKLYRKLGNIITALHGCIL